MDPFLLIIWIVGASARKASRATVAPGTFIGLVVAWTTVGVSLFLRPPFPSERPAQDLWGISSRGKGPYHPSPSPTEWPVTGIRRGECFEKLFQASLLRKEASPKSAASGASLEMRREPIFSDGCTPCVRVIRPHGCRSIPFPPDGLTMSRWPRGHMPESNPSLPPGVQSPPLRGDAPQYRRFHGDKPRDRAKGGFLGGARSPRPGGKAVPKPRYGMTAGR